MKHAVGLRVIQKMMKCPIRSLKAALKTSILCRYKNSYTVTSFFIELSSISLETGLLDYPS